MSALVQVGFLVLLLVLFWTVMSRPAKRQRQLVEQMQDGLQIGDEVVTSSGIFGAIAQLADTRVGLEIAPGIVVEMSRQAIVRKVDDAELGREPEPTSDVDDTHEGPEASND